MADLSKTQAQFNRVVGDELALILKERRFAKELLARYTLERQQVLVSRDPRSNFDSSVGDLTADGVDYGTNTNSRGQVFCRVTGAGDPRTVSWYKATGAGGGDLVAQGTANVGAVATLAASNSSGLTGTYPISAGFVADTDDGHIIEFYVDPSYTSAKVWTQTDGIDDDQHSRVAFTDYLAASASAARTILRANTALMQRWGLRDGNRNPKARGNDFLESNETSLSSDVKVVDGSGNVTRRRTGLFPRLSTVMEDDTTAGEQSVPVRTVTATAGVFSSSNDGLGTVASHTPLVKCPAAVWTFRCSRGGDTGDIGREEFSMTASVTDTEETITDSGLIIGTSYTGPRGFGPITLVRTLSKTGDGTNVDFAAATAASATGESNSNTDNGSIHWQVVSNGSNWDYSGYSSSTLAASTLVCKVENVVTAAAFTALAQNASGLQVIWQSGTAPTTTNTAILKLNPFQVENASGVPDEFKVTTAITADGLWQKLISEGFNAQINQDATPTFSDDYVKAGTFTDFAVQDQ